MDGDRDDAHRGIEDTLGQVLGSDLVAHLDRDAVLWVDASLDLRVCALAIARDNAHAVQSWLSMGVIKRPTAAERAAWRAATDRPWRAVVVQPFVLVQSLD
jgi:hypothetical protein